MRYRQVLGLVFLFVLSTLLCNCRNDEDSKQEVNNSKEHEKQLVKYILNEKSSSVGFDLEITEHFDSDTSFITVVYRDEQVHNFELLKEWLIITLQTIEYPDFHSGTKYICIGIQEAKDIVQTAFVINAFDFVEGSFENDKHKKFLDDLVYFYQLDGGKTLNEINYLLENATEVGEDLGIYENDFLNLLELFYQECEFNGFHYTRMMMLFAWTGATNERKYFDILNNVFAKCGFEKFTIQELKTLIEYLGAPPVIPWEDASDNG